MADTLAAHSMGGFKVGVGFSFRKCRMCPAVQKLNIVRIYTYIYACTTSLCIDSSIHLFSM